MNRSINEKICELRKARSLTQEKLGSLLGVSSQAVSKWEKGESLPDIMIIPTLCEVLGITADALLEVPESVQKNDCMCNLKEYARKVGEIRASFESLQACSVVSSDHKGSAQISDTGIRINNTRGYGIIISGKDMLTKIANTPASSIKRICNIINDDNVMKVFAALDFEKPKSELDISNDTGLAINEIQPILFKLLKANICECRDDEKYVFGLNSYVIFATLAGIYLDSQDGRKDIYSISRNYMAK